jgi:hypothetical protein
MLAHQAPDLFMVYDEALLTQRRPDPAIAVDSNASQMANMASTMAVLSAAFIGRS